MRDQPITRDRNALHFRHIVAEALLPTFKIDRAGEWRQHDELGKGQVGRLGQRGGGGERVFAISRESENEAPQNVHTMGAERLQAHGEAVARFVEVLENGLQALFSHRLHSNERPEDVGLFHCHQELHVLARFHRNLREENHVLGQQGQFLHEVEPLVANLLQLGYTRRVALLFRQMDVGDGHRVKVIVGQSNEAVPETPELDDFVNDHIRLALARLLPVRAPNRTEGTMLRAAANSLDGRPHVFVAPCQIPAGRDELLA